MGNIILILKGGKYIAHGYIMIHKPKHLTSNKQGYIPEHRYIMEKSINRYLKKNEIVHHINGDTFDNRIENLFIHSRSSHAYYHFPKNSKFGKNSLVK